MSSAPPDVSASGRRRGVIAQRRRHLQVALGVIWLIDAALQYQPYMFTKQFVVQALRAHRGRKPLDPLSTDDLGGPLHDSRHHTVERRSTPRSRSSSPSGCSGGPRSAGHSASPLSGASPCGGSRRASAGYSPAVRRPRWAAPVRSSSTCYSPFCSGPARGDRYERSVVRSSPLGRLAPNLLWAVLWGSFAYYLLLAVNRGPQDLHDMVAGMASGEPGWIQSLDSGIATLLNHHGTEFSVFLAVLCIVDRNRRLRSLARSPRARRRARLLPGDMAGRGFRWNPHLAGHRRELWSPARVAGVGLLAGCDSGGSGPGPVRAHATSAHVSVAMDVPMDWNSQLCC